MIDQLRRPHVSAVLNAAQALIEALHDDAPSVVRIEAARAVLDAEQSHREADLRRRIEELEQRTTRKDHGPRLGP